VTFNKKAFQKCIRPNCGATFGIRSIITSCQFCGSLIDITYDFDDLPVPHPISTRATHFSTDSSKGATHLSEAAALGATHLSTSRQGDGNVIWGSGVWRFHEFLPFASLDSCVTVGEGRTILLLADGLAKRIGLRPNRLYLQYEGMNPSGSFKDNGMAAALTHAKIVGAKLAACASTGNTSASLAMYAGVTGDFQAVVFVGSDKIAFGKLAQALDYGALTIQIQGDFDDAMRRVCEASTELKMYLVNSLNPFRIEGQKTIMLRVLEVLDWQVPDWIVVPGGNLGNSSAFGKIFAELKQHGLIDRIPRMAIINARGAATLDYLVNQKRLEWAGGEYDSRVANEYYDHLRASGTKARTVASAIEINQPVNLPKCLRALEVTNGVVRSVSDAQILDAKALVGRYGFGCEPASAATVAGVRSMIAEGIINPDDRVVCVLTGHALKDPNVTVDYHTDPLGPESGKADRVSFANSPVVVANDIDAIIAAIRNRLDKI